MGMMPQNMNMMNNNQNMMNMMNNQNMMNNMNKGNFVMQNMGMPFQK